MGHIESVRMEAASASALWFSICSDPAAASTSIPALKLQARASASRGSARAERAVQTMRNEHAPDCPRAARSLSLSFGNELAKPSSRALRCLHHPARRGETSESRARCRGSTGGDCTCGPQGAHTLRPEACERWAAPALQKRASTHRISPSI